MTKKDLINLFGGTKAACEALGITVANFHQFKEPLSEIQQDRVVGRLCRNGKWECAKELVGIPQVFE